MLNKRATIVLKFLIGIILGAILLFITYKIAGAVLSLAFTQDDNTYFSQLHETIEKLGLNKKTEFLYSINKDHFLIGFNKDANIVNNFKRPEKCKEKTCICKCNKELDTEACNKLSAQCHTFEKDLKIFYEDRDLFIQGEFKQILSIERTNNLIKIKQP